MKPILSAIVVFAIGLALGRLLSASPEPEVTYREVIVSDTVIVEREPPARPPTIVERIRYVDVPVLQLARAPGGAAADVAAFCRPTVLHTTDTVPADTVILVRSFTHRPAPFWKPLAKDGLTVTGPNSHGDLWAADYRVRDGFSARTAGSELEVRYPRFSVAGDIIDLLGLVSLTIHAVGLIR
ncbi:MAG: IMCp domain-containing protein [Gemmatimonadota bacterium]